MYGKEDPLNGYEMPPGLSRQFTSTSGLDCLRMIDTIYIKQNFSLTQGKLFK
jgi:hypothetical protein